MRPHSSREVRAACGSSTRRSTAWSRTTRSRRASKSSCGPQGSGSRGSPALGRREGTPRDLVPLFALPRGAVPFYLLDEVEAALDDSNVVRFVELLRRYSDRAQFIVITHQKRTMEAADILYGVTMGGDGVSQVISRRLPSTTGPSSSRKAVRATATATAMGVEGRSNSRFRRSRFHRPPALCPSRRPGPGASGRRPRGRDQSPHASTKATNSGPVRTFAGWNGLPFAITTTPGWATPNTVADTPPRSSRRSAGPSPGSPVACNRVEYLGRAVRR